MPAKARAFDPSRLIEHPPSEMAYIVALARHQAKTGLSDPAFAIELGVHDSLWRHTKAGRWPLGLKLLSAGMDLVPYAIVTAAYNSLLTRARTRGNSTQNGRKPAQSSIPTSATPEPIITP